MTSADLKTEESLKRHCEFKGKIKILFTDIDGTLTLDGPIPAESYQALWRLHQAGIAVIPVTGRPAGWCDLICRFWPVRGVIGENGAFYFMLKDGKTLRHFAFSPQEQEHSRARLKEIETEILTEVPQAAVSPDQFSRMMDLAIDFCEDIPHLPMNEVLKIKAIFERHGATAKISNIHVNGWFGDYDKLSMCKTLLSQEFPGLQLKDCAFVGDSPNDEPMFEAFENSFAVANIQDFVDQIKFLPRYVTKSREGLGFVELTDQLLKA